MNSPPKDYCDPLDRTAWEAVCEWPAAARFDACRGGIDYAGLIQWRLLSAVSRALRIRHKLFDNSVELAILNTLRESGYRQLWIGEPAPSNLYDEVRARCDLNHARRGKKTVFAPIMTHQPQLLEQLKSRTDRLFIHNLPDPNFPPPSMIPAENKRWCKTLFDAVLCGLEKMDIDLLDTDRELLRTDIIRSDRLIRLARIQLEIIRPDLLMIPTEDGWYPRYYLDVAKALNIPTFLLQHGLDCEPFSFDNSRCEHAALWGPERIGRYRTPPRDVRVTGNPKYDHYQIEQIEWNPAGDFMLLALRPNFSDKLHFPSRSPAVQAELLDAVYDFLKKHPAEKLVIKMHPSSLAAPLLAQIEKRNAKGQCRISKQDESLDELLLNAKAVLTEDSTAGLDAMLSGKPVVFAHFMPCRPTLPMVKTGAALSGFGKAALLQALETIVSDRLDAAAMQAGQARFIEEFAGPLDGQAGQRVMEFMDDILTPLRSELPIEKQKQPADKSEIINRQSAIGNRQSAICHRSN